jgi:hypothetical protein
MDMTLVICVSRIQKRMVFETCINTDNEKVILKNSYNHHNFANYKSSCLLVQTQRFGG